MTPDGDIHYTHRRNHDGGNRRFTLAEDMIGKSFEILVRDNGHDFELYFNGELIAKNFHERPGRDFAWRWGPYRGARPMEHDALVFVNNVQMRANTTAPTDLVPYRLPTTSLAIPSATAAIEDFVQEQAPFTERTVQVGTRIEAEEFDLGGAGVAYNDTGVGNDGGVFRTDVDVDIFEASDGGPGFSVGKPNGNGTEWMEYTADVVAGTYDVDLRLAASGNDTTRTVRVLIADDASETSEFTELGTVSVPLTGSQSEWQTVTLADVDLTPWAGSDRVIRLETKGFNFQLNWIEFNSSVAMDFGDAPDSYGTLLADDGARHIATGPRLGTVRDSENDGSPTANAGGDVGDDGVMFGAIGAGSSGAAVNIQLSNLAQGESAKVDAWIDFDGSGTFELDEKILNSVSVNQSMQTLNYDLPANVANGDYYARVRLSTAGGLGPKELAADGEVEDYKVNVVAPPTVESVVFNGGNDQRSSLYSVRVTFDGPVDIDTSSGSPFAFSPAGSSDLVATQVPTIGEDDGKTVVDLTFAAGDPHVTSFGSLKDGAYQLKIDASRVTSTGEDAGAWLAGNGGSASAPYTTASVDNFYRKYGDADGNGSVGLADFAIFRSMFGRTSSDPAFLAELDSDGSGDIGLPDFAAFRGNFGI
jgi:hypothetical protein